MKRFLIGLGVLLGLTTPAIAKQPLLVFQNGVVIYDNTKNIQDIRTYNNARPLPPGYKRVCNNRYSKHDYRNRDCVYVTPNTYGNPYGGKNGYGYRAPHIGNPPPPIGYHPKPPMGNSPYNR